MKLAAGNAQHIGARKEQQDSFGFSSLDDAAFIAHGGVLAVLADGMGGMARGAEASRNAVDVFIREYQRKTRQESIEAALQRAIEAANLAVWVAAKQANLEGEMGTTLVAAVVSDRDLYWISAGDSRIYLRRGAGPRNDQPAFLCCTQDHDYGTELDELFQQGKINEDERAGPDRDALTSFLGLPALRKVDRPASPVRLFANDRVMLCSDGLYRTLSETEMAEAMQGDAAKCADALLGRALAKSLPNQDNTTVMVLHVQGAHPVPERTAARSRSWIAMAIAALGVAVLSAWIFQSGSAEPKQESPPVTDPGPTTSELAGEISKLNERVTALENKSEGKHEITSGALEEIKKSRDGGKSTGKGPR